MTVDDNSGNVVMADVAYPDRDTVAVSFSEPFTGIAYFNLAGVTYLIDQDLNNNRIKNLADPQSAQDAATLGWVLSQLQGQDWKDSARAVTVAALPRTRSGSVLTAAAVVVACEEAGSDSEGGSAGA